MAEPGQVIRRTDSELKNSYEVLIHGLFRMKRPKNLLHGIAKACNKWEMNHDDKLY